MTDLRLGFLGFVTLVLLLMYAQRSGRKIHATRVGMFPGVLGLNTSAAKQEFLHQGHRLVEYGYREFPDANFLVQTQDMERLVIAPKFLPELRMLPESQLSHSAALVEKHLGYYSGVDTILESHQHSDVCRVQLTQNLPSLLPAMSDELDFAMSQFLNACSPESFVAYPTYGFVFSMVLSVSSRVFVGDLLSRDHEWLQVVSAYLAEVVSTAKALRPYPPILRPLLRPILAPKGRMTLILSKAQKVLIPAIKTRRESHARHVDLLQFLVDTSKDEQYMPIILKLLVLTSAALHTSTMAAVNALYDMCARPEYIKILRDEAQAAILADGGSWQIGTIKKLKQLDGFFKESLRFNQPDTLGFNRKVISPIQLSDGTTTLSSGLFINMPAGPMSRDPAFYDDPDTFDAHRFYRPGKEEGRVAEPPEYDFTGIERGNVVWGNGRLTCPGRWYASAMNKLIIATLLIRYEIQFPDGQSTRPPSVYSDGGIMPSPAQEILIRKHL